MSETSKEKGSVLERKQQSGPQSEKMKERVKYEKDLRNEYCGKEVVLVGAQMVWAAGSIYMTHISETDKPSNRNTAKVPKDVPFAVLETLDKAVYTGVIKLKNNLSKTDKHALDNIEVKDMNEPSQIEELEEADALLHMYSPDALATELQRLEKEENTPRSFFKSLLKEETSGRNRQPYVDVIKPFVEESK